LDGMTAVVVFGSDGFFEKRRGVVLRALRTKRAGTFRFQVSFFVYEKRVHDTPLANANAR
jgi:hypothetical protein